MNTRDDDDDDMIFGSVTLSGCTGMARTSSVTSRRPP